MRPRLRVSSIAALLAAGAWLSGCATTENAASATVAAAQATGAAVAAAVTPAPTKGPALLRSQMEQSAGPAHFRNQQFVYGHEELRATHTPFEQNKTKFVSSVFVSSRDSFRGGKAQPAPGPVLGAAVGDAAASLAALAAAQYGVPSPVVQPLLAKLLPGFGY